MNATRLSLRALPAALMVAADVCGLQAERAAAEQTAFFERVTSSVAGKTFTPVIVEVPPAAAAPPQPHRGESMYAYVLTGTLRTAYDEPPIRTHREGESWFEPPAAHELLTENVSATQPAKLLVIYVSDTSDALNAGNRQ